MLCSYCSQVAVPAYNTGRETSDIDYFALCLKEMYYRTELNVFVFWFCLKQGLTSQTGLELRSLGWSQSHRKLTVSLPGRHGLKHENNMLIS